MAISKLGTDVSATGNTVPGTLSVSHTLVAGTNRKVVCFVGAENGNTLGVSGVTYGGVAMTLAISGNTGTSGSRARAEIWYLDNASLPANGAQNCVVTFTGTSSTPETNMFVAEYGGIAQGAPSAGDTDATNQTTPATIANSPLGAITSTRWALSCVVSGNTGATGFSHGQSQTEVLDFNDASSRFAVAELRGGTGQTSIDSTWADTLNRLVRVAAVWGTPIPIAITVPARSVSSAPTQATLSIIDDTVTFTIPYIQTGTTLTCTAAVDPGTLPSGGGVKFVLNEGLGGEVVQYTTGGAGPFSTNFTGLAKGTYTLDVYVVNSSNVVQGSDTDAAIGIGIGDIICAIGDSATTGWTSNTGGGGSATAVLNWTTSGSEHSTDNRNFRQYDPVDTGSGPMYFLGAWPRLNDLLTAAYGYPVFVMNEGCGGYTTDNIITRMGVTNFQNRMNALDPNVWLLHAGGNDAGLGLSKAYVKANYNTIIAAIKSSYAGTSANIYLARPIYLRGYPDADNPYEQAYCDAVDEIVAATTCQAGPDFYNWFLNHPEQQDTPADVHPNAAGYSSTADLWADILSGGAVEVVGAGGAVAGGKSAAESTSAVTGKAGALSGGASTLSASTSAQGAAGAVTGGASLGAAATALAGVGGAVAGGTGSADNASAVTGSAGAVSGGTSTVAETTTATGASGAIAGGASVATSETTVTGTGGAVVGGEATVETPQDNGLEFEATGGAVSGGAATVDAAQSTLGASGAIAGGSSTVASGTSVTGAAGAVAGGEAETSTPQPGPLEFVASGGAVLGGSSSVESARTTAGESGAVAGGLATVAQATAPTTTGGVVSGGYAAAQSSTTVSGAVGAVAGGYTYVAPASEVTGSAGTVLGGESTVVAPENGPLVFDATGGAVSGGTSDISAALSILAAGGAVLGGVSLVVIGIPVNAVWTSATVKADGNIKGTAKADGNIKGTISA